MRKYIRIVLGSLLAGGLGSAAAQQPDGGITPVPGSWTPRVIATARPVTETLPPVTPVKPPAPAVLPIVRSGDRSLDLAQPTSPGAGTQRVGASAPPLGACMTVEKVAPPQVTPGKPFVYDLVVRNVGAAEAQRVRVEEQVPADATVTGADPRPDVHGSVLSWDLGSVPAGGESRLRVGLQPGADGDLVTTAQVICATSCTMRARLARPALAVTATAPLSARVGDPVTFKLQVTNNTTAPLQRILVQVRLSAGLHHPEGLQIEAVLPQVAAGETKTLPLNATAASAGRQRLTVSAAPAGMDPINAEAALDVIEATVPAPVPAGVTGSPEMHPAPAVPAPLPPPVPPLPEPEALRPPAAGPRPATSPEQVQKQAEK